MKFMNDFTIYNRARKYLLRSGTAAAPFIITLHMCPAVEEYLTLPPEHVETHAYHPIEAPTIEFVTSGSSRDVSVRLVGVSATGSVGSLTPSTGLRPVGGNIMYVVP